MDRAEKEHLVFFDLYVLRNGGNISSENAFQAASSGEKLEGWDRKLGLKGEIALRSLVIFSLRQWTYSELIYHSHLS